ncbi:MAG: hypothetical protein EHM59_12710 [Betaproteobacteria bacterium]|nr:MAG: hypothetical protein EHM59_12710 [Betaproteobacteria bacterium]
MKLWVGVTDKEWFDALARVAPDEVNFWQPSGSRNFRVLQPGEPFLFKLPARTTSSSAEATLALRGQIAQIAADAATPDGQRFGAEYLMRGRLGQGAFRVLVTDAYQRRCAVTGEKTLPVLEAAHIRPYAEDGPLLSLIEHGWAQWEGLLQSLGARGSETVCLEYCVASPKAGGNPSQTDAMVITDSLALAFEAKWTEPPDRQTVAKRIDRGEQDGADASDTVKGWLAHLQPFTARELRVDDFKDMIYQNVHRVASACAVAKANGLRPEVVYLHFHPSPGKSAATTVSYEDDLRKLHRLLGSPPRLGFRVVEMPLEPTPAFDAIKNLDRRVGTTTAAVKAALLRGPLFTFGRPITARI